MNEKQFDANLRAALTAPPMPSHMDHKIDAALSRVQHRKQSVRRLTVSFGAAAAIAAGLFIFPAVQAQASLGGMLSALDKQTSAKVITYSVDEQGKRTQIGTTIIAKGDVEIRDGKLRARQIDVDMVSFVWDPIAKTYVESPRKQITGIRLSQMLGSASQFSVGKRVDITKSVVDGKEVTRVVVTSTKLPERYIIEADSKTQLPFHMSVESLERGKWRVRQEIDFVYEGGLSVKKPDPNVTPVIPEAEGQRRFEEAMTSMELGKFKGKNRSVIVRAVDVAADGTVFVAFQSGDMKINSWSGYHIGLTDSIGTNYVRGGDLLGHFDADTKLPKDGKFEVEVFIPVKPVASNVARKLQVSVAVNGAGEVDQIYPGDDFETGKNTINVVYPDGHTEPKKFPRPGGKGHFVKIVEKTVSDSTCQVRPEWAAKVAWELHHDIHAEIFKARYRAKWAMAAKEWALAEKYLNDELHWKRESEVQGLSPWEMDSTKKNLDIVRKNLGP